jgi:hypothetical protein
VAQVAIARKLAVRMTMIHFSDTAIARGSKAPNQPSDGLASTRVAPGCLACEPAARKLLHYAAEVCSNIRVNRTRHDIATSGRHPAIPQKMNHLKVILDKQYGYGIMVSVW